MMTNTVTNAKEELHAMTAVAEALERLDAEATARVIRWAAERFGKASGARAGGVHEKPANPLLDAKDETHGASEYEHLADLYGAASPETDSDRALVGGYWFQFVQGQPEFGAQTINSALKDLGHQVPNITNALGALKAQKPQLVVQLKKSGTSKQARKTYKLTTAGKAAVEAMITAE
jgi:hypothetical protein